MLATPKVKGVSFDKVYEPAEDTFLLLDCLELQINFLKSNFSETPIFLEIGCGSGIVTAFTQNHIFNSGAFLSTDINPYACQASIKTSRLNNYNACYMEAMRMDLASALRPKLVDILVFNPPYVPDDSLPRPPQSDDGDWLDFALLGGKQGMETTHRLLGDLDRILSRKGVAFILFCKRNNPEDVAKSASENGWQIVKILERKAGWEVLSVYRFSRLDYKKLNS